MLELILFNLEKKEKSFGVLRTLGWLLDWNTALIVAEHPKCLGPPTPVIVLWTSDGDAGDPPTLEVR